MTRLRTAVAVICLTGLVALTAGSAAASAATNAAPAAAVSTGSTGPGLDTIDRQGWRVQSTASVPQAGAEISTPGFSTASWLSVTPDDAGAPGTEIEALLQHGICLHDPAFAVHEGPPMDQHNVFFGHNLQRCFGLEDTIGPDTIPEFMVPWWFRTDFRPAAGPGDDVKVVVNGIVGQADVWINGTEVGSQSSVRGAFASQTFDITGLVRPGTNSIALEVYPNDPTTMLTVDNVDWTQIPSDNSTGIQFPIQLHVSHALSIDNAHVVQTDAPDLSSAALTVKADVANNTSRTQSATVSAAITAPYGGSTIQVSQSVTVPGGATQTVTFTPAAFGGLVVQHPQLWWPWQMGRQALYRLSASVSQNGSQSDAAPASTFGIRTITTFMTPPSDLAPQGVRVYAVNGRPIDFRGGGFGENLFLHYSAQDLTNQISLIKSMGLNGIRTEGKEMPADFYNQMDRAGILVDSGFQCCDFWAPNTDGTGVTMQDYQVMYQSSLAIGRRLRNHPSVMGFQWSDNAPVKHQETVSLQGFADADFQGPIVSSAEMNRTGRSGPAGEKEGPYDWVPPTYWYDTTHASRNAVDTDSTMTNVGGSWGFDSEQSAGHTVPTPDSLNRFMSADDLAALWQQPTAHQYHTNYESTDGNHVGYSFGTLANLDNALTNRYGAWSSLPQYVQQAQVQNYENVRSQFEAFVDHWTNGPTPSTGTVYWQLNKGWPTLLWSLYNSDYDQAGTFFGAKKANESLHVLYAYDNGTVTVDNLTGITQPNLSVEAKVRGLDGTVLDDQTVGGLSLPSQGVRNAVITPKVPGATTPPAAAQTFWVELLLKQRGTVVDRNVYWLSTQQDVVDWTNSQSNPQAWSAPNTPGQPQWANLQALQGLPQATVTAVAATRSRAGANGADTATSVTVTNTSSSAVSFFVRADVRRGTAAGQPRPGDNQVLPISWSDNDVTLWPGQSETLTGSYSASALNGDTPVVSLSGWNLPGLVVPAPSSAAAAAAQQAAAGRSGVEHFGDANGTALYTGSATPATPGTAVQPGTGFPNDNAVLAVTSRASSPTTKPASSFTQNDAADTFTLTVTNVGDDPTDGRTPVNLTDVLDFDVSFVSVAGAGWTCDSSDNPTIRCSQTGGPGGTPAVLQPGQSYAPLTITVGVSALAGYGTQDSTAGLHVTNAATVTGGLPNHGAFGTAPETPIVGQPNLTVIDSLDSAFRQGDPADQYQIIVMNQGAGSTTGSPIVATVSLPPEETAVALYGSGWACDVKALRCRRSDSVRGEDAEAPPITLVVSVSPTAPATVTQSVTVSGGGESAAPVTIKADTPVQPAAAAAPAPGGSLTVTSAHDGSFSQGDDADRYTVTVRNGGSTATQGTVTVVDTLPRGIGATRLTGDGWTCSLQPAVLPSPSNEFEPLNTCSRSDPLAAGAAYPPITVAVAVADNARPSLTNTVMVSAGGVSATSTDPTAVDQRPDLQVTGFPSGDGQPWGPFGRGDRNGESRYTIDVANVGFAPTAGAVTVAVDLPSGVTPLSISAGSGWSCSASKATCTRTGALADGAQDTITLRVAASPTAPTSGEAFVRVSGGGQIDPTNDAVRIPASVEFR